MKYKACRAFYHVVFRNGFDKFYKTEARMLESINHMTLKLFQILDCVVMCATV